MSLSGEPERGGLERGELERELVGPQLVGPQLEREPRGEADSEAVRELRSAGIDVCGWQGLGLCGVALSATTLYSVADSYYSRIRVLVSPTVSINHSYTESPTVTSAVNQQSKQSVTLSGEISRVL